MNASYTIYIGVQVVVPLDPTSLPASAPSDFEYLFFWAQIEIPIAVDRVDELTERLNYFVSWSSAIGTWVAAATTILTLIIAVLSGIVSFFGFSGYMQLKRTQERVQTNAEHLKKDADNLRSQIEATAAVAKQNYQNLESGIKSRVEFYRFYLLGQLYYDNSNFNQAHRYFEKAKQIESTPEVNLNLARCLTYRNSIDRAIAILERLRQDAPNDAGIVRALALSKRFRVPNQAILLFEEALERVGDDLRLRAKIENELGLVHRDLGDHSLAHQYYSQSNETLPNNPLTLYFLGVAEALLNRKEAAVRRLSLAASIARYAAETQEIKGIWERVITWSSLVANGDYELARSDWSGFAAAIQPEYMRLTIVAHVDCICEAFNVSKSEVSDLTTSGSEATRRVQG